jgi:hypothetical protein
MMGALTWDGTLPFSAESTYCGEVRPLDAAIIEDQKEDPDPFRRPRTMISPVDCGAIRAYMLGRTCAHAVGDLVDLDGNCAAVEDIAPDLPGIWVRASQCNASYHPREKCSRDADCPAGKKVTCEEGLCACAEPFFPCLFRLASTAPSGDYLALPNVETPYLSLPCGGPSRPGAKTPRPAPSAGKKPGTPSAFGPSPASSPPPPASSPPPPASKGNGGVLALAGLALVVLFLLSR